MGEILLNKDIKLTNSQLNIIIRASQEYAEQFIDLAAEEAEIEYTDGPVDKQSILKIKEQIK